MEIANAFITILDELGKKFVGFGENKVTIYEILYK